MLPSQQMEDYYNRLKTVKTTYDVFQFLKDVSEQYGFEKFSVLSMPTEVDAEISPFFLASNWPPELLQAYDQLGLLKNSPVIAGLRKSSSPLVWEIEGINEDRDEGEQDKAIKLFKDFNMKAGVYFPTYTSSGRRGAVSFAGPKMPLSHMEQSLLHMLSLYTFDHLIKIVEEASGNVPKLTRREHDCILWSAQGKTTAEVGTILSISEHTVSGYLNTACQKLDAVNKTHAVAKALRLGLLHGWAFLAVLWVTSDIA